MGGDSGEGQPNDALTFCEEEHDWLLETCELILRRQGLSGYLQAGDVADDVYIIMSRLRRELWVGVSDRKAYVARVVQNQIRRILRCEREIPMDADELAILNSLAKPHSPQNSAPYVILLQELLSKMTDDERRLFELWYYGNLPTKEIAAQLNCSDDAARQKVFRLRAKLQEILNTGGKSARSVRASRRDVAGRGHTANVPVVAPDDTQ